MTCLNVQRDEHKHYVHLVFWQSLISLLFLGHKCAMLFVHYMVRQSLARFGGDHTSVSSAFFAHGIPTYLCAAVIILSVGVLVTMSCSSRMNVPEQKKFIIWLSVCIIICTCLGTIVQTALILYEDILLFLRLKGENIANCYCTQETSPVDTDLFWCRCNVPAQQYPVGFSLKEPLVTLDVKTLNKYLDIQYHGEMHNVTVVESREILLQMTDIEFKDMKMLLAVAELSVFYVVLRIPIFFITGKAMVKDIAAADTKDGRDVEINNILAQYKDLKAHLVHHLKAYVEIVVFVFIESLDAFSLLDDIIEHRYEFSGNMILTQITLFLILTNNIIVNGASIGLSFGGNETTQIPMKQYRYWTKSNSIRDSSIESVKSRHRVDFGVMITKLLLVILSNLPFVALRSYLLYVYDGFENAQVGSVYVIFIAKEVVLFGLGVIEFVFGTRRMKHEKEEANKKTPSFMRSSPQSENNANQISTLDQSVEYLGDTTFINDVQVAGEEEAMSIHKMRKPTSEQSISQDMRLSTAGFSPIGRAAHWLGDPRLQSDVGTPSAYAM